MVGVVHIGIQTTVLHRQRLIFLSAWHEGMWRNGSTVQVILIYKVNGGE